MKIMKIALTLLFVLSASVIVQADTNTLMNWNAMQKKLFLKNLKNKCG